MSKTGTVYLQDAACSCPGRLIAGCGKEETMKLFKKLAAAVLAAALALTMVGCGGGNRACRTVAYGESGKALNGGAFTALG